MMSERIGTGEAFPDIAMTTPDGGSVKASNIVEIMSQPDIDGVLVGGASLDPAEFARIIQYRLR